MIDVMIIDDNTEIRDELKKLIVWEKSGIRFCCEAGDSETARELFLIYRPKIIITDINIPIISGLDLAKEFAEIDPDVRFIIITGYSVFEFAQRSVKIGAVDLITKPIQVDEINNSLKRAIHHIEKVRQENTLSREIEALLTENRPMLKERFVSSLLKNAAALSREEIKKRFNALDLPILNVNYAIAVLAPDISEAASENVDRLLVSTHSLADKFIREAGFNIFSYYDHDSLLVCFASWSFLKGEDRLEETINLVREKVRFYYSIQLFAGIGSTVQDIFLLPTSYQEANQALNYHAIDDSASIMHIQNVKSIERNPIQNTDQVMKHLVMLFNNNQFQQLSNLLDEYFHSIDAMQSNYLFEVKKFALVYISHLIAAAISQGNDHSSRFADLLLHISNANNLQSIHKHLCQFTQEQADTLFQSRNNSRNLLVEMARDYIEQNLKCKDLNLEKVSSHIGLSSIYFCKLFHKEVGTSFSEYLNYERIARAKQLLRNTTLKVFEVSDEIGYSSAKYFNYVFKRIVGTTPLEYKNNADANQGFPV